MHALVLAQAVEAVPWFMEALKSAPGAMIAIVVLVICLRYLEKREGQWSEQRKQDSDTRLAAMNACHDHNRTLAAKYEVCVDGLSEVVERNTLALGEAKAVNSQLIDAACDMKDALQRIAK